MNRYQIFDIHTRKPVPGTANGSRKQLQARRQLLNNHARELRYFIGLGPDHPRSHRDSRESR